MRLLLDTHIWLWIAFEPSRLAPRVREILANPENELWLSPISVWELTLVTSDEKLARLPGISVLRNR